MKYYLCSLISLALIWVILYYSTIPFGAIVPSNYFSGIRMADILTIICTPVVIVGVVLAVQNDKKSL